MDYVESMFSVREMPWHRLGLVLDKPPTMAEAIIQAGLDWEVTMADVQAVLERPFGEEELKHIVEAPKFKAICRDGRYQAGIPKEPQLYAIVTDRYRPLQNKDAFDFFQPMVDRGLVTLETAGSLKMGKIIWVLAKLADDLVVGQIRNKAGKMVDDQIGQYLLVYNIHDGKTAARIAFTPIRVVCYNTLNVSLSAEISHYLVKHTGAVDQKVRRISVNVADVLHAYRLIGQAFQELATIQVPLQQVDDFLAHMFPVLDPTDPKSVDLAVLKSEKVKANLEAEGRIAGRTLVYNRWQLLNALTGYYDHDARTRGGDDGRLSSIWFGQGAKQKTRAFAYLTKDTAMADVIQPTLN